MAVHVLSSMPPLIQVGIRTSGPRQAHGPGDKLLLKTALPLPIVLEPRNTERDIRNCHGKLLNLREVAFWESHGVRAFSRPEPPRSTVHATGKVVG